MVILFFATDISWDKVCNDKKFGVILHNLNVYVFYINAGESDIASQISPNLPISPENKAILRFSAKILPNIAEISLAFEVCLTNYFDCIMNDVKLKDWLSKICFLIFIWLCLVEYSILHIFYEIVKFFKL